MQLQHAWRPPAIPPSLEDHTSQLSELHLSDCGVDPPGLQRPLAKSAHAKVLDRSWTPVHDNEYCAERDTVSGTWDRFGDILRPSDHRFETLRLDHGQPARYRPLYRGTLDSLQPAPTLGSPRPLCNFLQLALPLHLLLAENAGPQRPLKASARPSKSSCQSRSSNSRYGTCQCRAEMGRASLKWETTVRCTRSVW